jgi:hypothetical protein
MRKGLKMYNKEAKTLSDIYEEEVLDTPWFRTNDRKMVKEAFDLAIRYAIARIQSCKGD